MISLLDEVGERENLYSRTSNISSTGAYLQTERCLPEGSNVEVEIKFPKIYWNGNNFMIGQVVVNGKVVRCSPEGMAIQFDEDFQISSVPLKNMEYDA